MISGFDINRISLYDNFHSNFDSDSPMVENNKEALKARLYTIFLGLIAATPPLATDMYLAAIPRIADEWSVEKSTVNLSLILWFVSFSMTLLIWGSLSDRFGRRPVLLSGLIGFVVSSIFCAFSNLIWQLIASRVIQGISAAGISSMVMAIARDRFEGKQRQKILAWIGIILGIAPMVAPSLGAAFLKYANWRFIFASQAILASISLLMATIFYKETALQLETGGLASVIRRYIRLSKNTNYVLTNMAAGILNAPFLGFIAFSASAYIVHFGMSEQRFALIFSANAVCSVLGSSLCIRLIRNHGEYKLITVTFIGCLFGGLILLFTGGLHWFMFASGMGFFSFFFGMSRPLVNHMILEQVDQDIGSASSGIICYQFIVGAIGMAVSTHEWSHPFRVFGIIAASCPLAVLSVWPFLYRRIK